jgi:hypothetical protein
MKNEEKSQHGDTRSLTWKNLSNREIKTMGASQQNFTISGVFYKPRGLSNDAINPRQVRPVAG